MPDALTLPLLAIAALALLELSAHMMRNYEWARGLLAAVLGIGVLAVTVFKIYPALNDTRLVTLTAAHAKLKAENKTLAHDKADVEHLAERSIATFEQEIGDLRGAVARPELGLLVDETAREPLPPKGATLPERLDRAATELRDLQTLRARPVPPPTPSAAEVSRMDDTRDLMRLKDGMATRLETPSYNVEVYPDKELVSGKPGRYYVVDLKNAVSGIRYYFAGGKYTLPQANAEFRTSLNTFIADVLKKMEGRVHYELYVRGNADAKAYQGAFETGHHFNQVTYLKALGGGRYSTEAASATLSGTVHNEDLPNLRATFLSKLVGEVYPVKPPVVLEGTVTSQTNDRDRNAELLLYVDW